MQSVRSKYWAALAFCILLHFPQTPITASDYYWNPPTGGAGTWNTSTPLWSTNLLGPADSTWSNTGGTAPHDAIFGGVGGIVSQASSITANLLRFESGGYAVNQTGGAVLTAYGFDTGSNNASVAVVLNGTGGLSKYGTGTLAYNTSTVSLTGPIHVQQGTLNVVGGINALPSGSTTTVHGGATLEVTAFFGLDSFSPISVATLPTGAFRMAPSGSSAATLQNVYLAGGSLIGASTMFGNSDMFVAGAIHTRGSVASTVNVAKGIGFNAPNAPMNPYTSLAIHDVTQSSAADLTITGTATGGALLNTGSTSMPIIKSGNGTLILNAPNNSPNFGLPRYSVQSGVLRLEGAETQNRMPANAIVSVAGTLELADTNVLRQTNGIDLDMYGGTLSVVGASTGRNQIRSLRFSEGGTLKTTGTVSSTAGENLRVGTFMPLTVTSPANLRVPVATINLSHGLGMEGSLTIDVADTSRDANADLQIIGTGGLKSNLFSAGLNKTGAGTLRIETPSTYFGATGISGGVLSIPSIANGGVASPLGASDNSQFNLTLGGGGTLRYTGTSTTTDRGFSTNGGSIEVEIGSTSLTFTGTTSGSGTLQKRGPGTLTLSGSTFGSTPPQIFDGLLKISGNASLAFADAVTVNGASGMMHGSDALPLHQIRRGALQLDGITGSQLPSTNTGTQLNGGAVLYTPSGAGTQTAIAPKITLASGFNTLAVAPSTGPDQLSITSLHRQTGATVEFRSQFGPLGGSGDNGRIVVTSFNGSPLSNVNGILGGWAIANNPAVGAEGTGASDWFATSLGSGNIGAFTNYTATSTDTTPLSSATATQNWRVNGGSASNRTLTTSNTIHSLITGGPNVGDGDLTINATLTLGSGGIIAREASHAFGGSGGINSSTNEIFVHTPSTLDSGQNLKITASLSGTLVKDGPGELIVERANNFITATHVHQGRLTATGGSTPLGSGPVTVKPGGQLVLSNVPSGVGITAGGMGTAGTDGMTGAVRLINSGASITMTAATRVGAEGNSSLFSLVGAFDFEKTGAGNLSLSGNYDSFTGYTRVSEGTLQLNTDEALPNSPSVNVRSGATLLLSADSAFSTAKPGIVLLEGGTLRTNSNRNNYFTSLTLNGGTIDAGTGVSASSGVIMRQPSSAITNVVRLDTLASTNSSVVTGAGISIDNQAALFATVEDGPAAADLVFDGPLRGSILGSSVSKLGEGTMVFQGNADNALLKVNLANGALVLAKQSSSTIHAMGSSTNALTISGGTLRLGGTGGDQIPSVVDVLMDSGAFDLNGRNEGFDGLTGQSGVIRNDAVGTTSTLTLGQENGSSNWYGYVADGAGKVAVTKVGTGTIALGGANTFTGGATVSAGTLRIEGLLANATSTNVNVAIDPDGNFATAGPTITFDNFRDDSYAGLGSKAIGGLNSSADILGGANVDGSDLNVAMRWRARTAAESTAPLSPPLEEAIYPVVSNVLELTGMVNNRLSAGESDLFVLQMSYDPTLIPSLARPQLGWLDPNGAGPGIAQWRSAIEGNFGTNIGPDGFYGSWVAAGSPLALGANGYDPVAKVAWAVINHNSQFAVIIVPETASPLVAALFGMLALLAARRSSKTTLLA